MTCLPGVATDAKNAVLKPVFTEPRYAPKYPPLATYNVCVLCEMSMSKASQRDDSMSRLVTWLTHSWLTGVKAVQSYAPVT